MDVHFNSCPQCAYSSEPQFNRCPRCSFTPTWQNGFPCFAAELSRSSVGFSSEYFAQLAPLEGRNFWFVTRNMLIRSLLTTYALESKEYLEVGCGTGFVLNLAAETLPNARITGTEIYTTGLKVAADRVPRANLYQMDARKIPFRSHFDCAGAFDVLEHILEHEAVMDQIFSALKPGGYFLASVPQHRWLWSAADTYACHVRRYDAGELESALERVGFRIVRSFSFMSILLPLLLTSRLRSMRKAAEYDPNSELRVNPILNRLLQAITHFELWFTRMGINFPIGGSRFVVAEKPK